MSARLTSPVFVALVLASLIKADDGKLSAWTPELMLRVKRIGGVQVSPDGKRVAFTVREAVTEGEKSEYLTHIHLADADGGNPLQLTHGDKSCDDPQWSPKGDCLAFVSSRAGKRNLYLIQVRGGEAQQLTNLKSDVRGFKWSPDGNWIAFTALDPLSADEEKATKEKNDARVVDDNIKLSRLYVVQVDKSFAKPASTRPLTAGNYSVGDEGRISRTSFDWSPDSKTIVFVRSRSPRPDDWTTSDLGLVEVASGSVKPLLQTPAAEFSPLWSPDGRWIVYVKSDNPPTWAGAARIHLTTPTGDDLPPLADTFDTFGRFSELIGWSADSAEIFYSEVQGTVFRLGALPIRGQPRSLGQVDGMGSGVHLNYSRTMFGLGWEAMDRPAEAHVTPIGSFAPVQVSRANADLPKPALGRTEVIRWKSADGMEIEGLLTYPAGFEKGKRYPLLLNIHGGPMGVFTQSYTGAAGLYPIAVFASRGYAVLRPNIRGSSGYGKKFRYANYGDWGGGDFKDAMAGVDHVIAVGIADPERLGVAGWSYGGFMTSWVITQTKRFQAASVGAGVTNLMSFTGTADIPGFLPDYFGGEFWDKLDAYRMHSAMFQVKGVSTPTLIQHGERDERVPLSQGQELYNALRRQGCTVKMVVYPRTPHGIEEPKLLLDCMTRNLDWFDKYVRNRER